MAKGQKKQAQEKINKDTFEGLCKILCTEQEIIGIFGVSERTLYRWCENTYQEKFADVYKKLAEFGKASLRRSQFKIAQTNASMAIWLGKQYLGQKDYADSTPQDKIQVINDVPKEDK